MSDGIGDRLLMFDNSQAPSLELLRFRPELADARGFEAALREQVKRLAKFHHPAFARVRAVQRLEPDGDLALVSNHTPGKRLTEVLHRARGPAFASALIRQLAPALAQFQQQHPGVAHGLLSPDRIVVSPDAQLTIVEHVVAPAIEQLDLYTLPLGWMGIALPPASNGAAARLDVATDWYQLGLVTLAALLGRPLTEDEMPRLGRLLDQLSSSAGGDGAPLSPVVRQWLDRTLQLSGARIESGADAREAVADVLQDDGPRQPRRVAPMRLGAPAPVQVPIPTAFVQPIETIVTDAPAAPVARPKAVAPLETVAPAREAATRPHVIEAAVRDAKPPRVPAPKAIIEPALEPVLAAGIAPGLAFAGAPSLFNVPIRVVEPALSPFEREVLAGRTTEPNSEVTSPGSGVVKSKTVPISIAAGIALFAVIEAGVIAWMVRSPAGSSSSTVAVETTPAGEHVIVRAGATEPAPLRLTLGPDLGWVRVSAASTQGVVGGKVAETTAGTMRILSPVALKVFEGSRLLGSAPGADLKLLPGRHDLDLVNDALGYRQQHTVQVEPGQTLSIHVTPPAGSVTIEAVAGTDVSIDGQAVGRTPLAALSVAPGDHQIVLRHPKDGSDRQRVTVKAAAATSVVAKLR